MFGSLEQLSEDELLNYVQIIFSKPADLSAFDQTELEQINDEFIRRGSYRDHKLLKQLGQSSKGRGQNDNQRV